MEPFTERREIDAPAEVVWAIVADYARDPEWRGDVVEMSSDPPGLVTEGCRTHEVMKIGGRTYRNDGAVDRVVPGSSLAWHTDRGVDASGSRTVRSLGGERCEVTLELHVTPRGLDRLLAPVLRPMVAKALRRDLATLADLARADRAPVVG